LACSQSGDHPENSLAKLGYMLDMKVKKKRKKFLFTPTGWRKSGI
jgi:hypothetical protein